MQWITRERPKVDRVACPWLVRRFVDPAAEFVYVAADRVESASVLATRLAGRSFGPEPDPPSLLI